MRVYQSSTRLRLSRPGSYTWTGAAGAGALAAPDVVRSAVGLSKMGPIYFKNAGTGPFTINGQVYDTAQRASISLAPGESAILFPGVKVWNKA